MHIPLFDAEANDNCYGTLAHNRGQRQLPCHSCSHMPTLLLADVSANRSL